MTDPRGPAQLRLRPLTPDDEVAAWAAHDELSLEGFDFLLGADHEESWRAHLGRMERHRAGIDLPEGWVPATFLVADVAGVIVGRVSVRHELDDWLSLVGGHIGYAVRPSFRRRGYATAMLRASLGVARAAGVSRALLTCDDDNVGSITTIERCGGAAGHPSRTGLRQAQAPLLVADGRGLLTSTAVCAEGQVPSRTT